MLWRRQEAVGPEASVGFGNRDATGDLDRSPDQCLGFRECGT